MFTILVITDTGCEDACIEEIKRWTKAKTKKYLNVIELEGSFHEALVLGYYLQTARRVVLQMERFGALDELQGRKPDQEILKLIPKEATFKVEADVLSMTLDEETAPLCLAQELVEEVGGWSNTHLQQKVKLNNPDIVIYALATPERIYIGLDVIGRSLAKRDWRISLSRRSLKSTVAAATIIYADAAEDDRILDPLADDGSIVIEAALLFSRTSPRLFDRKFSFDISKAKKEKKEIHKIIAFAANLQDMKSIRTNSKLAGVDKFIHSTKVTVDWMDAKIEKGEIDKIITAPIPSGKAITMQQVSKINDQLFYQAEYVLKKGGTLTAITEKPIELLDAAKKYKFTESNTRDVLMGKRRMTIVTYRK